MSVEQDTNNLIEVFPGKSVRSKSWDEIKTEYPDQWVGLTDVEYEASNSPTIISAVVLYVNRSKDELILEQIQSKGKVVARYTNPNKLFQLGVLV